MGQSRREMQVGIAVLLSVIILVVGMLWFKQYRFAGGTLRYAVDSPGVDALQARDRVQVRGIRMGAVDELAIVDDHVRVTFHVDQKADLRADAGFRLQTIGIVGEKVIEIDPGTGDPVQEGHIFKGEAEMSISGMSATASEALTEVKGLASELRAFLGEIRKEGQVPATLTAAREAAGGVGDLVTENRGGVHDLVEDLQGTASALRTALAGPDSALAGAASGAASAFTRADSVLANLERISASLLVVVERLEAGEGSAGRLLTDDSLLVRADSTLAAVEELLDDVRRNPRKYFKFSFIDF